MSAACCYVMLCFYKFLYYCYFYGINKTKRNETKLIKSTIYIINLKSKNKKSL